MANPLLHYSFPTPRETLPVSRSGPPFPCASLPVGLSGAQNTPNKLTRRESPTALRSSRDIRGKRRRPANLRPGGRATRELARALYFFVGGEKKKKALRGAGCALLSGAGCALLSGAGHTLRPRAPSRRVPAVSRTEPRAQTGGGCARRCAADARSAAPAGPGGCSRAACGGGDPDCRRPPEP